MRFWRIALMDRQQIEPNSRRKAWRLKSTGWMVGAAMFLSSGQALALTPNPEPVIEQERSPQEVLLAQADDDPRFSCQVVNGEYTVVYHPESQAGEGYPWAVPRELGGGWTPERRCDEIARRLEFYRPDGLLEMRTSVENNYDIVCVTTQQEPDCRIVLTVPPGQDPELTRDRVFENLAVADTGQETDAVNTFAGGNRNSQLLDRALNEGLSALGLGNIAPRRSRGINLQPFLAPDDGGTGTQLNSPLSVPANPSLNPERFR
jgi:hypothetical protein